jgi:cytochrome P450
MTPERRQVNSAVQYRPMLGALDPLVADLDFRGGRVVGMPEILDRLRDAGRKVAIVKWGEVPEAYLILGYEAVERAYTNHDEVPTHLFFQQSVAELFGQVVSGQQGDEFRWHRAMAAPPFGPMRMRGLVEPLLVPVANRLIDRWAGRRRVEFVSEFAHLYPFDVISEMLAIPQEDRETVRGHVKLLFHLDDPDTARRAHAEMSDYLQGLIRERRRCPGDDLISHYVTAEVGGRGYTDKELSDAIRFLYPAAGENTMNALGTLLYYVLSLPGVYDRVRRNPDDRPAAVEESLRIRSSVQFMMRYIDKPMLIDGLEIPANSYLLLSNSSANRDPSRFEDPTVFSLDRELNKHIAFGRGANFCLGAHLARAELRTMLDLVLARLEGLRLAPDQKIIFEGASIHGLRSLDIEFDALRPA